MDFVCLNCKQIVSLLISKSSEEDTCSCGSTDLLKIKPKFNTTKRTLYFLVGPTGAGKNHIINSLPDRIGNVPSVTTRKPRENEVNGVDYWFIDEAAMKALQDKKKLCESVNYGGYLYGVSSDIFINQMFNSSFDLALVVEPNGLNQMLDYIRNNYSLLTFNNFSVEIVFLDIPRGVRLINMLADKGISEMDIFNFYSWNLNPGQPIDSDLLEKNKTIESVLSRLVRSGDRIAEIMKEFMDKRRVFIDKIINETDISIIFRTLTTKKDINQFIDGIRIGHSNAKRLEEILSESDIDQLKIMQQILYSNILSREDAQMQIDRVKG